MTFDCTQTLCNPGLLLRVKDTSREPRLQSYSGQQRAIARRLETWAAGLVHSLFFTSPKATSALLFENLGPEGPGLGRALGGVRSANPTAFH